MKKKKKNKKRKLSIYKFTGIFLFIVSIITFVMALIMDILPTKYLLVVVIGLLFLNGIIDWFLFRKKVKKYKKNIALCFAILIMVFLCFPIYYMRRTISFISNIVDIDYSTENYSVVVLKDSEYEKVSDVKNLSVGIYENTSGMKDAKDELLSNVDVTFDIKDSLNELSEELLNKKIEVVFLEDSLLNMIKEDNSEFDANVKVIYSIKIKIKNKKQAKEVNVVSEPFNIYLTGIDTYGEISSVSRSDVNIVMTVNPKTKQILLTSIPRDYYVELHGKKGSRDKLTHAGIYGEEMSIKTIEDLLGIEINYYFKVNFTSFIDIINALGGVEVYSKYTFTSIDGRHYNEGMNQLNGEEALSFARERKAFSEGDRQRGADQQAVIEAVIKKLSSKSILSNYDSLLKSVDGKFLTNMNSKKITSLIKMQLNDMASWNVKSISLDGYNGKGITYSGGNQELYVMIPDWNTVDEASSTIKDVLDGKKIDDSYKPDKNNSTRKIKSYSDTIKKKVDTETESEAKNEVVEEIKKESNVITIEENKDDLDEGVKEVEIVIDKKVDDESNKNTEEDSLVNNEIADDNSENKADNKEAEMIEESSNNQNSSDNDLINIEENN